MNAHLKDRSQNVCELCKSPKDLGQIELKSGSEELDNLVAICAKCSQELTKLEAYDTNHFRCLNDSMWSEYKPVQILVYRVLTLLSSEAWANDLKSQMYLEESEIDIAISNLQGATSKAGSVQKDSNGAVLNAGDNVTLIKDLVVKGANFTAKRGTVVRNIALTDNSEHIEGKVNGTRIVLVTKFLKKVNE